MYTVQTGRGHKSLAYKMDQFIAPEKKYLENCQYGGRGSM